MRPYKNTPGTFTCTKDIGITYTCTKDIVLRIPVQKTYRYVQLLFNNMFQSVAEVTYIRLFLISKIVLFYLFSLALKICLNSINFGNVPNIRINKIFCFSYTSTVIYLSTSIHFIDSSYRNLSNGKLYCITHHLTKLYLVET